MRIGLAFPRRFTRQIAAVRRDCNRWVAMSEVEIGPEFEPAIVVDSLAGGGFRATVASVGIVAEGPTRAAVLKRVDKQLSEAGEAGDKYREALAPLYAV